MQIFRSLVTVNILISNVFAVSAIPTVPSPSGNSINGSKCSFNAGTKTIAGVCTNVQKCGYAISNYLVGITPTLCAPIKNGIAIACCPTEERISAKKCREYSKLLQERKPIEIRPLSTNIRFAEAQQPARTQEVTHKCEIVPTAFITSGRNAKTDEFPYMAALGYGELGEKNWKCGGTIISDEFVLTAAHCINTRFGKPRRVLVGSIYLQDPGNTRRKTLVAVKETIVYPNYRKPLKYNDIALLKLSKKLPLSKSIFPACLPQPNMRPEHVKAGRITGWGTVEANVNRNANILQAASIGRYNQSACNELFLKKPDKAIGYPQGIIRSQFCAGDKVMDTCNGDSGGPFTINQGNNHCLHYVVGITSFGSVFCGYGEPGVYTNVQSYLDWIESVVWPPF